jgi:hypothetical protein
MEDQPRTGTLTSNDAAAIPLRGRPFAYEYAAVNALQLVPEFKQLLEGSNLLAFIAYLRRQTIESGGRPGRVSWPVWLQAAEDLGLGATRAAILWRGAQFADTDRGASAVQSLDVFSEYDSVPLARLGALLFLSSVIPRPLAREVDAAWLDFPSPTTITESVPQLLKEAARWETQTKVIDLQSGEVTEHLSFEQKSISDVMAVTTSSMEKILGMVEKGKFYPAGSYISTLRRLPAILQYNCTFQTKILVISLGLTFTNGDVCADVITPWNPKGRPDANTGTKSADDIDWNDIWIPLRCIEHFRFLFELPDVPLTLGWDATQIVEGISEPAVKFADSVSYLFDLFNILLGTCFIRNKNLPWAHIRSIAGLRAVASLRPYRWEVSALVRSTLIKRIDHEDTADIDIRGCKDCRLEFVPGDATTIAHVTIGQCVDCTIFVAACKTLMLTTSERVTILAAVHAELRIINCLECQIYILCNERPVAYGDNRLVYIGPAAYNFDGLDSILSRHGIRTDSNRWSEPYDFERDGTPTSNTVALIPPSSYWPPVLAWKNATDLRSCPWQIEKEYLEVFEHRSASVDRLRRSVCDRFGDRKDAMSQLQDLVHARFREWLGNGNRMRSVHDLLRMERTEAKEAPKDSSEQSAS